MDALQGNFAGLSDPVHEAMNATSAKVSYKIEVSIMQADQCIYLILLSCSGSDISPCLDRSMLGVSKACRVVAR